jgi:hypothetical protein
MEAWAVVRLLAMLILILTLAAPARADTSIVISGGGFTFFSGSESFAHSRRHFHGHHQRHWGSIWRQRQGDHWSFYHPGRRHLLLGQTHGHGVLLSRRHRDWRHGHGHGWSFEKQERRPQIVIVVPGSAESRIKIVTAPGQPAFATVFDPLAGTIALVPRPILKPSHLASGQ